MNSPDQLKRAKDTLWAEVNRNIPRTEDNKPGFVLDEHNTPVMRELAHHLVDAPCQWLERGCGIAMTGPVGTGKTDIMKALSRTIIRGGGEGFEIVSAIELEKRYSMSSKDENQNGGPKIILKYGNMDRDLCIDDLGEEPKGQHFGNVCDVIGEIISLREKLWKSRGRLTHCTSNIIDEEGLRKKYDPRTASRLLGMMRWVPLGGDDRRPTSKPMVRQSELFLPEPPMPTEEEIARNRAAFDEGMRRVKEAAEAARKELYEGREKQAAA